MTYSESFWDKNGKCLTIEILKQWGMSRDIINFMVRNNIIGFPLKFIKSIEDDYNQYVQQLKYCMISDYKHYTRYKHYKIVELYSEGGTSTHTYDENWNILTTIFHNGLKNLHTYDNGGNMITSRLLPYKEKTLFTYDSNGYISTSSYPCGSNYTFTCNDHGDILSKISMDGYKEFYEYTYDEIGNMLSKRYPNGEIHNFNPKPMIESIMRLWYYKI